MKNNKITALFFLSFILTTTSVYADWHQDRLDSSVKIHGSSTYQDFAPVFRDNKLYWLFGNEVPNGSAASSNLTTLNLTSMAAQSIQLKYPISLIGNSLSSYQNKIYSYGGYKNNQINHVMNTLVSYSFATNQLETLPAAPFARADACTVTYNNKLYVFGGSGFDTFNKPILKLDDSNFYYTELSEKISLRPDVQVYDIQKQTWSISAINKLLPDRLSCASVDEAFFFIGSESFHSTTNEIHKYDLILNQWSKIALPQGLSYPKLVSVDQKLIVTGKLDATKNGPWSFFQYNTTTAHWDELPQLASNTNSIYFTSFNNKVAVIEKSSGNNIDEELSVFTYTLGDLKSQTQANLLQSSYNFSAEQTIEQFTVQSVGYDNLVNMTVHDQEIYQDLWSGKDKRDALKLLTKPLYQAVNDEFDFLVIIINEETVDKTTDTRYHVPIANNIQGIGQGIFDFTNAYGSNGKLESIVVLKQKNDLIYGPSLHEMMHRWGNYLKGPLDSTRQENWFSLHTKFHWDYLSHGGQLGGWNQEDFNYKLFDDQSLYLLNDSKEGRVGFSGVGGGTNFHPYSNLELYLMGAVSENELPELFEPAHKPQESEFYPFYEINEFNTVNKEELLRINGTRQPSSSIARKELSPLFVIISDESLTFEEWNNYSKQVNNFIKKGPDDYFRLNNFWEATKGLVSLREVDYNTILKPHLSSQLSNIKKPIVKAPKSLIVKLVDQAFLLASDEPVQALLSEVEVDHDRTSAFSLVHNIPNLITKGHTQVKLYAYSPIVQSESQIVDIYADYDSDSDGYIDLLDAFPNNSSEWLDSDGDGLGNNIDTDDDNDGLADVDEIELGTDPLSSDSDGDGISDFDEVKLGSNPLNAKEDTDKDGYSNLEELAMGTSPIDKNDYPQSYPGWINILLEEK